MKKWLMIGLLAMTQSCHADHTEIWRNIQLLHDATGKLFARVTPLETKTAVLESTVNSWPKPTSYIPGKGIDIDNNIIQLSLHHVGEEFHGGIIFWVDETGNHGLIASKNDLNHGQGISWRNGTAGTKTTNARADGVGAGALNTQLIIAQQTADNQSGSFAALIAASYRVTDDGETPCPTPIPAELTCYGDWYLPSAYELSLMHNNLRLSQLSHFAPVFYWSSTEHSTSKAWLQNFSTGELTVSDKASTLGNIRAVSRF